jgi:hypothetical protein
MDKNPLDFCVINAALGDKKFHCPLQLNADETFQYFVTVINKKFPDTVTNWRRY